MGLRINHNISSLAALRNLRINDRNQQRSLERLSTGSRINKASDDPSGLVISERLRAQINGLQQAVENSQGASNMIGTAEAALNEVQNLLVGIRESVLFAINDGGSSPEQIAAEQDSVDNTIGAIRRIASTTRFGQKQLLNGTSGFIVSDRDADITELNARNVQFTSSNATFSVNVTSAAVQADLASFAYAGADDAAIIRISGSLGVEEIAITSTMTVNEFDEAVNAVKWNTGVFSDSGTLTSLEYGSEEKVTLEVVSGSFNSDAGSLTSTDGAQVGEGDDVKGNINGVDFSAIGNRLTIRSSFFTGEVLLSSAAAGGGSYDFTIDKSGLTFQLGSGSSLNDRETIGIASMDPSSLGSPERVVTGDTMGGYLTSLLAGGDNDLFSDPANALRIVDEAIDDVSDMRAALGAFKAFTIDTNVNSLEVAIENLTASESMIRDLDFAAETSEFTRTQILFQAGTAVLAQANLIPQSVLTLLQ